MNAYEKLITKPTIHHSYCMSCASTTHANMLTGYCIPKCHCDRCGCLSDLAMVRLDKPEITLYGRKILEKNK